MTKRYRIAAAAHNLGRIMRLLFGIGKPKGLQDDGALAALRRLCAVAEAGALLPLAKLVIWIGDSLRYDERPINRACAA